MGEGDQAGLALILRIAGSLAVHGGLEAVLFLVVRDVESHAFQHATGYVVPCRVSLWVRPVDSAARTDVYFAPVTSTRRPSGFDGPPSQTTSVTGWASPSST